MSAEEEAIAVIPSPDTSNPEQDPDIIMWKEYDDLVCLQNADMNLEAVALEVLGHCYKNKDNDIGCNEDRNNALLWFFTNHRVKQEKYNL